MSDQVTTRPYDNVGASKEAIQYHYDIGNDFYRQWLDEQLLYTCAYFEQPGMTLEQGQEEARQVGLNMLATLRAEIGDLDRVRRVVKVLGMVNAAPDFRDHPKVINGFSDLMVEVFGETGRGARSAVGMGSLPFQIPVEVEMIVEID